VDQVRVRNDELSEAASGRHDDDPIERTHPVIGFGWSE
jgi:hypothetical protein